MKNNETAKKILNWLILFTLCFIWSNSMLGREASSSESGAVMEIIRPVLEIFVGEGNVTEHLVRKLAHFCEFALLGAEVMLRFLLMEKTAGQAGRLAASHGLFAAFADETIQIFSGRGPSVQDMWIDFAGVICGALFSFAVAALIRRIKRSAEAHRQ